jgi:hypothetical protein
MLVSQWHGRYNMVCSSGQGSCHISTTERLHGKHVNVCHDRTFRQRVLRSYHRVATKVSIVTETDKAE